MVEPWKSTLAQAHMRIKRVDCVSPNISTSLTYISAHFPKIAFPYTYRSSQSTLQSHNGSLLEAEVSIPVEDQGDEAERVYHQ